MTSKFPEHTSANYFLHTGSGVQGRPSMGAWFSYGLGSENRNLPASIVLNGGLIPPGGLDTFTSGFLPAAYQGSVFRAADPPVANIRRGAIPRADLPGLGWRPLGPAQQLEGGAREQRTGRRTGDRRTGQGPQGPRLAGNDAGGLGGRIRPHAVRPACGRPGPQPVRLHD